MKNKINLCFQWKVLITLYSIQFPNCLVKRGSTNMILKKPPIFEETEKFIEVEIPEGKREEYDLEGYELSGKGEGSGGFFEYFIKDKPKMLNSQLNKTGGKEQNKV